MSEEIDPRIFQAVTDAVAVGLSVDRERLQLDTDLRRDLDADSMDLVSLTVLLEEAFPDWEGTIDEDRFAEVRTIEDIVLFVQALAPHEQ